MNTDCQSCRNRPDGRSWEGHRRLLSHHHVFSWMPSNVELVGNGQPFVVAGLPPAAVRTPSTDRLSDGSGPSATLRSPDAPLAGSKPGPLKAFKSLRIGAGIWGDVRSRVPYYASDWTDAWNYRVVPATTLIFFAKYGPCSTETPDSPDFFQRSSGNCLLFGSHRDYWKVRCCGSFTLFCSCCRGLLGVRRAAVVHRRCYRHVWLLGH